MPPNTVYVGRPTKWGNHWTVKQYFEARGETYNTELDVLHAMKTCVEAYRAWMTGEKHWAFGCIIPFVPTIEELRGKNLACWCPHGFPCHADVLLDLANK
jgi:hypothetical protein